MTDTENLLDLIEAFLRRSGMAAGTFGHKTARDGKLVRRLREGKTVTIETAGVITRFIEAETAKLDAEKAKAKRTRAGERRVA